jgi:F0F1-type ATP synthase assembly protein I
VGVAGGPPDKYKQVRQLGLLTTIPMILAAAPLVGYFLGQWLDRKVGSAPVFAFLGIGLGLVAGVRETIVIVRKASQDSKNGQAD